VPPQASWRSRALVGGLCGLALAELVTAVVAALAGHVSLAGAVGTFTVTDGAMGLAFPVCGGLLAWHRPRNPIGWLFLAAGVGMATTAAAAPLLQWAARSDWSQGTLRLLGTVLVYTWPWSIGLFLPMALLLFPDGRPAGPRWRWLVWATAAQSVLFVLTFANPAPQVFDGQRVTPPKTVANHISAIFTKLQVTGRSEAIILARDGGLGRNAPGPPG
jgi:two-component system NarL family sensor kinase